MLDKDHFLAYYRSEWWQQMRQRALAYYGPHCAVCGDDYKARGDKLDIHHCFYFRPGGQQIFYHETMDDLRVLCHRHHPKGKFSAESIRRWRNSYLFGKAAKLFARFLWLGIRRLLTFIWWILRPRPTEAR